MYNAKLCSVANDEYGQISQVEIVTLLYSKQQHENPSLSLIHSLMLYGP
jgi:hypothetical protein